MFEIEKLGIVVRKRSMRFDILIYCYPRHAYENVGCSFQYHLFYMGRDTENQIFQFFCPFLTLSIRKNVNFVTVYFYKCQTALI